MIESLIATGIIRGLGPTLSGPSARLSRTGRGVNSGGKYSRVHAAEGTQEYRSSVRSRNCAGKTINLLRRRASVKGAERRVITTSALPSANGRGYHHQAGTGVEHADSKVNLRIRLEPEQQCPRC